MANKIGLTLVTAGCLLAAIVLFVAGASSAAQARTGTSTEFSAQQQQENKGQQKKAAPGARPALQPAAPQRAAPQRAAPQRAAPQRSAASVRLPRAVRNSVWSLRRRRLRAWLHRAGRYQARLLGRKPLRAWSRQPKSTPKVVAPTAAGRKATSRTAAPRVVTPRGTRAVTASRLRGVPARGAGRAVIRGQNYSAWRSGYRVRHGSGWRTFVALSALGAIAIGSSQYYPYAYISAPEPYCEGLTEHGCQLMWQEVETIEGNVINRCVAYCPWQ